VLHTIGELDEAGYERVRAVEPRLRQVFAESGSWIDIVKTQLDLAPEFEEQVETAWATQQERASAAGQTVDATEFARAVADRVVGT
jgi:hypothetical protein